MGLSFRIAGIPVRVDWTFPLIAVLLGLGAREGAELALWVGVVFVSVLVHELGHALTFRAFGHAPRILLHSMGGLTFGSERPLTRAQNIAVTAAGSLTQIVLLGVPALLVHRAGIVEAIPWDLVPADLARVSIFWGVLNLLPVFPLDGGRLAGYLLGAVPGWDGERIARWVSLGMTGAGAAWAFASDEPFLALFALFFAAENANALSQARAAPYAARLAEGHRALDAGDAAAAARAAEEVLAKARPAALRSAAAELLAWTALASGGDPDEALRRRPQPAPPSRMLDAYRAFAAGDVEGGVDAVAGAVERGEPWPANALLTGRVAEAGALGLLVDRLLGLPAAGGPEAVHRLAHDLHRLGRFLEAVSVDRRLYESGRFDLGLTAYNVACGLARAGETTVALAWLERAVQHGYADADQLDGDPDLASLRADPAFAALREKVAAAGERR